MEREFGSRLPQRFENVGTNYFCALLRLPLVSARAEAPLHPLASGQQQRARTFSYLRLDVEGDAVVRQSVLAQ